MYLTLIEVPVLLNLKLHFFNSIYADDIGSRSG